MTIETVSRPGDPPTPWLTKLNPLWWLVGNDGWTVPTVNNGLPYLPEVTNVWLRRFYWFVCRNPLMNFVGLVMGVGDKPWTATGPAPVMATTGRDATPPIFGWRWALVQASWSPGALIVWLIMILLTIFFSWLFIVPAMIAFFKGIGEMPYVSFWNGKVEFYLGWRPYSGGFGFKLVFPKGA